MSIWVVVAKTMAFFYKMRACRTSPAGLCITINSTGLGSVVVAGNSLLTVILQFFSKYPAMGIGHSLLPLECHGLVEQLEKLLRKRETLVTNLKRKKVQSIRVRG